MLQGTQPQSALYTQFGLQQVTIAGFPDPPMTDRVASPRRPSGSRAALAADAHSILPIHDLHASFVA
jgi:hypothetical protein